MENILTLFLKVRERFDEIKEKVSLAKPYLELLIFSNGWALKIEELEKILKFKPEFIYKSNEENYAILIRYRIDDDATTGIIAHEFAEIIARENNIEEQELIDKICVERGFGEQLLYALKNEVLPEIAEESLINGQDLKKRIENLENMLKS
ncbi:MAG: hypothetical protein AB1610_05170 [Nitrospirota bacterium]